MAGLAFVLLALQLSRVQLVGGGDPLTQLPHPLADQPTVDFSDNLIVWIDYIERLPAMEWFVLDRNLLESFPDFANNTHVIGVSLAHNRLPSVPEGLLDPLANLTHLNLTGNRLTGFPDPAGAVSLRYLRLAWNNLTELPDWPRLGSSLLDLDVGFNAMTSLARERLARLRSLLYLSANDNRLAGPAPAIDVMTDVVYVGLDGNLLSEFDARVVRLLYGFVTVDLSRNRISHVTFLYELYRPTLFDHVTVFLFDNPVACDCRSRWLKEALLTGRPMIIGATCGSPEDKAALPVDIVPMADLRCDDAPIRSLYAARVESSWLPPYDVIGTPYARSVFGCIQLCYEQEGCLLFGFRPSTGQCALTSVYVRSTPNASPWDGDDVTWIVMT